MRHCALVSDTSDVLTEGGVAHVYCSVYAFYILLVVCKCDAFMCFDVYGVLVIVECSSFLLSGNDLQDIEWSMCVGCCDFCLIGDAYILAFNDCCG